jgi:carbon monoxide dehydrogenase subunit G
VSVLLAIADPAAALSRIDHFDVVRDAAAYRVDASADLSASAVVAWDALTDYESLPRFMPGIERVRVLSDNEEGGRRRLRVEQSGELHWLLFTQHIGVLLDVVHEPRARVDAVAVPRPGRGDDSGVKSFEATYTLQPVGQGVRLAYRARIVPDFHLPPFFDGWLLRRTLRAQFDAMLGEIERRRLAAAGAAR